MGRGGSSNRRVHADRTEWRTRRQCRLENMQGPCRNPWLKPWGYTSTLVQTRCRWIRQVRSRLAALARCAHAVDATHGTRLARPSLRAAASWAIASSRNDDVAVTRMSAGRDGSG